MHRVTWSSILLVMFLTLCALGGVIVVWVLPQMHEEALKPRPSPPPYPNAQKIEQRADLSDVSFPTGTISFVTSDTPDSVQTFYRDFLKRAGWKYGDYIFPDAPHIAYYQYWPDDGPVYKVLVSALQVDGAQTSVTITMTSNYHNWYGEFWK